MFSQLEISSCVHRPGEVLVTKCKGVGKEESDGNGDIYVLKSKILDLSYCFSRQAVEKLLVNMAPTDVCIVLVRGLLVMLG